MEELIEKTGSNIVLDALWFAERWGIEEKNITLRDAFGLTGDIDNLVYQIIAGKYRLVITWHGHIGAIFSSEEELTNSISQNINGCYKKAVSLVREYIYELNIGLGTDGSHDGDAYSSPLAMCHAQDKRLINDTIKNRIQVFFPVIQKFMVDALTDSLKIEEEEEAQKH